MKLSLVSLKNEEKGKIELPRQFNECVNGDLIKRAVLAIQANSRQPYGAMPEAGERASARVSKRRRDFRGCYGHGISRVPRKVMSARGTRFNWTGALIPGTVGGRRAHPPKAEKIIGKKINEKENRGAIRSAISATVIRDVVGKRHKLPGNYPFVVENSIEAAEKTKVVKQILETLGFSGELERTVDRKIRAGKGKMRGRKYRNRKGLLIVVGEGCKLLKSARNIPGIDIVGVKGLNAELLAPGTVPGRVTLFTESAIKKMEKEGLFL